MVAGLLRNSGLPTGEPALQEVEVQPLVLPDHCFTIQDGATGYDSGRSRGYFREPGGEVGAVLRPQPGVPVADGDRDPEPVKFELVQAIAGQCVRSGDLFFGPGQLDGHRAAQPRRQFLGQFSCYTGVQ